MHARMQSDIGNQLDWLDNRQARCDEVAHPCSMYQVCPGTFAEARLHAGQAQTCLGQLVPSISIEGTAPSE